MAQIKLNWKYTAADIALKTNELIDKAKSVYDAVGNLTDENINYDNVIKVLADNDSIYKCVRNNLDFFQNVSSDADMRKASVESDKILSEFEVEMSMRVDVFERLIKLESILKNINVDPEAIRFLERMIKHGRRNGLHLSAEKRDEIKEIKKKMSDLSIDFNKNLNEDITVLHFSVDELKGLPEDFLKDRKQNENGLYEVSLKYPDYFPCMKYAANPETRKKLENAFNSRCLVENTKILEELIILRQRKAAILDFKTHSAFVLEMRMAKSAERVTEFLKEIRQKLDTLIGAEIAEFLELKKADCLNMGYDYDGKIHMWDMRYYVTRVEEGKYCVDQNKLKEYFPMDVVTKGLLDIYQELLDLKFNLVDGAHTWHEDVTLYSVTDNETKNLIGYFYLDLYPRDGKYGHAACFGLQPGCVLSDGEKQISVAAMVANFTKATEHQPSLLSHDEVETYFHEFGHVMHQICAESKFAMFSGTAVERDFVEAPSQMLENWCWEKESLLRMSKHYKDGSQIPDDLLQSLIKSRIACAGILNLRQIMLGTFDQQIHMTNGPVNTADVLGELSQEIMKVKSTPGTNMAASFGHLAGGYDAQYYGYMWSEVFSADMFYSVFKKNGIMNPEIGKKYRKCILQPGGTIDADEMLVNFLGRPPKVEAFLKSKGLKVDFD